MQKKYKTKGGKNTQPTPQEDNHATSQVQPQQPQQTVATDKVNIRNSYSFDKNLL